MPYKGDRVRASDGVKKKNFLETKSPLQVHGIKTNELVRLCGGTLKLELVSGHEMYHLEMAPNSQHVQFGQSH